MAGGFSDDTSSFSDVPADTGASEPPTLIGCLLMLGVAVTYFGVNPSHQAVNPENQPVDTGGWPFPSYAGDAMA